ncbi:unnamed protein product [[Candida] boidinii]|nr:unnamed protein product [[Candida] boidinii]
MGELDPRWDETIIRQIWTSILSPMDIVFHSVKVIRDKQALSTGLSNSGYCFLKFHNFDDATKVLNNFNGQPIPGTNNTRYFRLNWASSSNKLLGGSQPTVASHEFNIFVGDLNQDVKESTLFQIFQTRFPSTSGVRIMVDPITGNSKGYGFIKFLNEEEQKRALVEMQGMSVNGRPIRVSTATKSSLTVGSGQSNSPQPSIGGGTTPTTSASNLSNDGGNTTLPDTGSNVNSSVGGSFQSTSSISTINSQNQQQHNNNNSNSNSSLSQSQPSQMIQSNNQGPNPHQQMQMQQRISLPPLPATIPLQYYNDPNNTTVFIGDPTWEKLWVCSILS